jgi:hypothetical protein
MRSLINWAMFNGRLIIYPKVSSGTSFEITGTLTPPYYDDSDLYKKMMVVPSDDDEVQGLSNEQLKLVRYRVIARLMEDAKDYQGAQYMDNKAALLEHQMHKSFEDSGYTGSVGIMKGSPNV